jgi:hypothetical protein
METQRLTAELVKQLQARPYWTTAGIFCVGWVLGRTLPLRAVLAMAGVGARAAMTVAMEDVARSARTDSARTEEATI